jgi:hypothetical protein
MGQMPMGGPMGNPMGGPPMGGPMGPPPMGALPRPIRRGTSKAVPVVVSAGLAIGVFCGLLFGVGTGKDEANAAPSSGNNVKEDKDEPIKPEPGAAPQGLGATSTVDTKTPPPAGSNAGSAVAAAGSAAGSAAVPPPAATEPKKLKLTIQVKPEEAAKAAKITVDGTAIEGAMIELAPDTKTVKIEVKASGYHSANKKLDLSGDDITFEVEMAKRSTTVRPPKRPDRPPGNPSSGGGLIDI